MKTKILFSILPLLSFCWGSMFAQDDQKRIGDVETVQVWYYVYDTDGDRIGSISNQEGDLIGFSDCIIVLRKFNFYYFYNPSLERYAQKSVDSIGEIVSVQSNGFTAVRNGRRINYDVNGNPR